MTRCKESVYGTHQMTDTRGCCLLCGEKIESAARFGPDSIKRRQAARAQDPLSVDGPDEADYLDGFS
jgi:hypothetical protein